jgi:proteasome lid subunit RPN8/RPN11
MNNKMVLLLSEGAVEEIAQHAQETFPEECCGVILTHGTIDRVHRLKNIQNQLHVLDRKLPAHGNHRLRDGL